MATTTTRRRPARPDPAVLAELERDRDRTRKNIQASEERTAQYRRHLSALDAALSWLT